MRVVTLVQNSQSSRTAFLGMRLIFIQGSVPNQCELTQFVDLRINIPTPDLLPYTMKSLRYDPVRQ